MKKTFIISFVLLLLLNLVSYLLLPDKVAVHFGKGGRADSYAGKEINFLIFTGLEVLFFLMFLYTPTLIKNTPAKWISLPNKNYWLKEENRAAALKKIEVFMYEFGTALFLFFLMLTFLSLDAHQSTPPRLNENLFFPVFIAFMIYTLYWSIKLILSFKVPRDQGNRY